jgi:hypothetical protein
VKFVLKVAAAIILAAALINGLAAAGHASDEARLGWFMPIAHDAWPNNPCNGRTVVHLHADVYLGSEAATFGVRPLQLLGLSKPATCEIWLRTGLDALTFCAALTHEDGHLAQGPTGRPAVDRYGATHGPLDRLGHTSVSGDIMSGDGNIEWKPCDDAVLTARARGRSQAATRLRAQRSRQRSRAHRR